MLPSKRSTTCFIILWLTFVTLQAACSPQPAPTAEPRTETTATTVKAQSQVVLPAKTITPTPSTTAPPPTPTYAGPTPLPTFAVSRTITQLGSLTVEDTELGPVGDYRLGYEDVSQNDDFYQRIPPEVLERHRSIGQLSQDGSLEAINAALENFGYRLEGTDWNYTLYQGEQVLSDKVGLYHHFRLNRSQSDFVLLLTIDNYQIWLLRKDRFELFYDGTPRLRPIFIGDDLFTADEESTDEGFNYVVRQEDTVIYRYEKVVLGPDTCPVDFFRNWQEHWIMQIDGQVIIDGQPLGTEPGYQAAFNWQLVNGKPIYLFEKDGSYGVSYDGQELPLRYEHIVHWPCLGGYPFYPFGAHGRDGLITFFAQNEGRWHFVQIGQP